MIPLTSLYIWLSDVTLIVENLGLKLRKKVFMTPAIADVLVCVVSSICAFKKSLEVRLTLEVWDRKVQRRMHNGETHADAILPTRDHAYPRHLVVR